MEKGTIRALDQWALNVTNDIREFLGRSNVNSTGRLIDSIRTVVTETEKGYELDLLMEDYGRFVLEGRAPGKQPPVDKIQEWTRTKGIPEEAAWAIAKKIGRDGIKGFNFLAPFYQSLPQLTSSIEREYAKEIEGETVKLLKNIRLK